METSNLNRWLNYFNERCDLDYETIKHLAKLFDQEQEAEDLAACWLIGELEEYEQSEDY